ncbi:hypothetical protein BOTBODRAFT_37964 [Botryobasidium botryosum FD-172 SS1]|uniref:Uncharacterized protein n=1 Tax=Botryobasidium botryosum (strain FD-172 SS1) TaxID=930990 RepID=A0A067LYC2_BOTB1|nr:hypothetical protein BOTBODRAFT_37964 [Botryobasidium botryosum FD-172 SS1]
MGVMVRKQGCFYIPTTVFFAAQRAYAVPEYIIDSTPGALPTSAVRANVRQPVYILTVEWHRTAVDGGARKDSGIIV